MMNMQEQNKKERWNSSRAKEKNNHPYGSNRSNWLLTINWLW